MRKFSVTQNQKVRMLAFTIAFCCATVSVSIFASGSAHAAGGSWGSSLGGFGSGGGSWGGGGLLGGRTPVRNLLGRIGSQSIGGGSSGGSVGGGSYGSFGGGSTGNFGGSRGGLLGFGILGGGNLRGRIFNGSIGGSLGGSSGGGYGSAGGYASTGSWSGSNGSIAGGSSGGYPIVGASYISTPVLASPVYASPVVSAPMETSYAIGNYSSETSYPVGDYGFEPGYPMQSTIPYGGTGQVIGGVPMNSGFTDPSFMGGVISDPYGVPGAVPVGGMGGVIQDGGSIDSMLDGGGNVIPLNGGSSNPPIDPNYYQDGGGAAPVNPGPEIDDQTSKQTIDKATVLNVVLPDAAKVYINGQLTKTKGARRSYKSKRLTEGRDYKYQVKAVLVRNGKELVKTKLVNLRHGLDQTVNFDFEESVTTLALTVPENAKVKLCGNDTVSQGSVRYFATKRLEEGDVWKDYKVQVEYEVDGELKTEERVVNLNAGETCRLVIGMDEAATSVASK
ncbi:MAG: TIGR03000 domain-containing protein [Mariniblastus sp.]